MTLVNRIGARVFTHWQARKLEWWLAMATFGFGVWLMAPWVSFATVGYIGVAALLGEFAWGCLYLCVGAGHCYALHVNGRAWWTPFLRVATLFTNSQVFLAFAIAFYGQNPASTAVYIYSACVVACCFAIIPAFEDCGKEIKIMRGRNA